MVKRLSGDKPLDKGGISKIVAMHNSALECISLLEDIMNLIFLCYHFVFLVVLSFVLFGISKYSNDFPADRVFTFLLCALGKVLAMCYTGKRLNDLAAELSFVIYDTKWYDAPLDIQQNILLMLQMSQKRVGLTAGKFYYADMESFAELVNESYSYYLIMKKMLDN
ncbi:odorant receptor 85b-like [Culex quinquefasciatus]|uniref:odorant receptor 85b-like n=1 Tax=Culex quinquefasciatus TaxID=7176 RepID=UPI0018E2A363|nr:odorant receptor 85b-like [Culex quinquefasciatus]